MRMNLIAKLSVVFLTFFFFGAFLVSASPVWGSCRIENISLKKDGDFTKICVYADKPFEFSHSTEEAKDGMPYRVIIDCKDAVWGLPQPNFTEGLPPGTIKAIRTSQFQAEPERIVRVVLDLNGPVVYKVAEPETEYEASIAILTTQDSDFPMWVAVLEEEKEKKISKGKKQTKVAPTLTVPQKDQKSDKSHASLLSTESSPELTASEKKKAELAQKERIYPRAVCYADTGKVVLSAKKKPIFLSQTQSKGEDIKKEEVSQTIKQKPVLLVPEFSSEASSRQTTQRIQSSFSGEEARRIEEDRTQKDVASASAELVLDPASQTGAEEKKTPPISVLSSKLSSKQSLTERSAPQQQTGHSPVPLGPFPEEQSSDKDKVATEKTEIAEPEAEGKENVSTGTPGSVQKGIGKILGPESATAKESQALAESLILIQTPQESELSLVPKRKMVHYDHGNRRDPFLPLTGKQDLSFGEAPLPLFEDLKLVGILKDEEGNRALLENEMGFGYILKSGDKIKNGYVIRVEDDRAFFHVEEYGGYQIMVLELNREY